MGPIMFEIVAFQFIAVKCYTKRRLTRQRRIQRGPRFATSCEKDEVKFIQTVLHLDMIAKATKGT